MFLKLEAVFFSELKDSTEWPEMRLYRDLKEFTLIVHQQEFTEENFIRLDMLADTILRSCQALKLRPESDDHTQVYCKLHQLSHYSGSIRRFGPAYLYS